MRKLIATIGACVALSLAGCSHGEKSASEKSIESVNASTYLDRFVDSLMVEFPDALNNDITRSALADTIKSRMNRFRGGELPFLAECPVVFYHSEKFPKRQFETFEHYTDKNADKVMVQFVYQKITDRRGIGFSILTAMTEEEAMKLKDGATYQVKGNFLFFPDNTPECVFFLPNHKLAQNTTSVSTESGAPLYMIGNFIMDDVTFAQMQ